MVAACILSLYTALLGLGSDQIDGVGRVQCWQAAGGMLYAVRRIHAGTAQTRLIQGSTLFFVLPHLRRFRTVPWAFVSHPPTLLQPPFVVRQPFSLFQTDHFLPFLKLCCFERKSKPNIGFGPWNPVQFRATDDI